MTKDTCKHSAKQTDSIAFRYLREQVAREMKGVYAALAQVDVKKPATQEPPSLAFQYLREQVAREMKGVYDALAPKAPRNK